MFQKHVPTTIHLFDSLIKPILLYASDFWGCLKLPKHNPLETLHQRFCKELLGVQIHTPNLGVLLEIGRIPLTIYGKKNAAKNWERICVNKKANPIVLSSYENDQENSWANLTKHCFASVGLLDVFLNLRPGKTPNMQLFDQEKGIFQQTSSSKTCQN